MPHAGIIPEADAFPANMLNFAAATVRTPGASPLVRLKGKRVGVSRNPVAVCLPQCAGAHCAMSARTTCRRVTDAKAIAAPRLREGAASGEPEDLPQPYSVGTCERRERTAHRESPGTAFPQRQCVSVTLPQRLCMSCFAPRAEVFQSETHA